MGKRFFGFTLSPLLFALSSDGKRGGPWEKRGTIFYPRSSIFGFLLGAMFFALCSPAEAQQAGKVYRIGYLSASAVNEAFRQGLRDLGYIEGRNLAIEFRQAEVNERHPELAAELVRLRADLIFTVEQGREGTP